MSDSKPALFVVALPHTEANADFVADAYQMKHRKFPPMMMRHGYEVYSLAGEHSDMEATEHIVVSSDAEKLRWFGDFDHHKDFFPITWGPNETHWVEMNNNAIQEIRQRIQPKDIICLIAGHCQKQIADAFPNNMVVEYGIGYTGVFSPYKVFESYAHMHWCYGHANDDNGYFYDCVIPNYFEVDDFDLGEGGEYLLWMGRFIQRKGPEIAVEVSNRLGIPLVMAGQGAFQEGNTVYSNDRSFSLSGDQIKHIGHVDAKQRSELMGKAITTIMGTTYLEPFGGVSVESMLCGTPVVATDFGAFPENVHPPVGYRFRTIGEACDAVHQVMELDRETVRDYAISRYSTERAAELYDAYFQQLQTLYEKTPEGSKFRQDGFYSDWAAPNLRRYV